MTDDVLLIILSQIAKKVIIANLFPLHQLKAFKGIHFPMGESNDFFLHAESGR